MLVSVSLQSIVAQELRLSIDELFSLADEQSLTLATSKSEIAEAEMAVSSAKTARTPDIDLEVQLSYNGDAWISDRDFSNGMSVSTPHFGNMFDIAVTQVIYAGGSIRNSISMANLQKSMAELTHADTKQSIRLVLTGYFLELCQLINQKTILEKNIDQTQKLLDDIEANYEAGTALKSDITRYELQLQGLQLNLTQTINAIDIGNRNLTQTLNLAPTTVIVPDTAFLKLRPHVGDEADWQQAAQASPTVKQAELAVEMSQKAEQLSKADMRPTVALRIEDKLNGPITYEVPPLDNNVNFWYAGIGVSYNLGSLYKQRRTVSEKKIATNTAATRLSDVQNATSANIHAAYVRYHEALTTLATCEKSLQLANENYDVVHYRYLNGMALITDMLDASNQQLSSELQLMNAEINIALNHYVLLASAGQL